MSPATEAAGLLPQRFPSFDDTQLAWRELGRGRPVILVHGLFSHAEMNWLRWGTAGVLAKAGLRVILPDLRAHGLSDAPPDASRYPPDVLPLDLEAFVAHLGLEDFDLVGYSLGARTGVRSVVRGLAPRRLVLAGMGLGGILRFEDRSAFFLNVIEQQKKFDPGTPEWLVAQFMRSTGVDPRGAAHVLRSQAAIRREDLGAITMPTLVVCGEDDRDTGSGAELAEALPNARYAAVPGNHLGAVTTPELAREIRDFLVQPDPVGTAGP